MAHSFDEGKPEVNHSEVRMSPSSTGDAMDYTDATLVDRGAWLLQQEQDLGVWQTAKIHWRALLVCT